MKLLPYSFKPRVAVDKRYDGWKIFSWKAEFERMGLGAPNVLWRVTTINKTYQV